MLTTWTPYARIGRPLEAHNVATPQAFLAAQTAAIAGNLAARPGMTWRPPFDAIAAPQLGGPFINGGRWGVWCPCQGLASYDPDWQLACCFNCGAIYRLAPPEGWARAEALLMGREQMVNRHWLPYGGFGLPPESLEDLLRDNRARGLPDR